MTNPNQVRQFMAARRISPWSLSDVVIDAIVAWGMTCASAEVERRRVAEAERDAAVAQLAVMRANFLVEVMRATRARCGVNTEAVHE